MKNYKQLLKELPSSTVYCAVAEFDPPTVDHEIVVKTVKKLAEEKHSAHVIYTSPSKNSVLQEDKKTQYLSLLFPKIKFQSIKETFIEEIEKLKNRYKNVTIVASEEQISSLKRVLKESVKFISITEKDPDSNNSKMRSLANKGLLEEFKQKLPTTIRELDSKRLMNDIRFGMGLEPIKEQLNLVKDSLREQYFRAEIFNLGDLVESDGITYEIVKRGSNHLLLKEESGQLVSKWIHEVHQLNEGVIQQSGTDKINTNSPEADTGVKQEMQPKGKTKGFLTFYNYDLKKNRDESNTVKEEIVGAALIPKEDNEKYLGVHHLRKQKVKHHLGEAKKKKPDPVQDRPGVSTENMPETDPFFKESDLSDKDISELIESISFDDILDLYEEDEIALVYEDNGEEVPVCEEESQIDLMEVLSRTERMRSKIRFRKTKAKRERSTKIALKRFSPVKTINARARRLAVRLMKQRLLRGRSYKDVGIGDKERIDKIISSRKQIINRIAAKLVSRVRGVEKSRLSQTGYTKPNTPQVF